MQKRTSPGKSVIYYIGLNLSVCVSVCVCVCLCVCPFVLYANPQFWDDRRETWHEASLGHWPERGQVGDSAQGERPASAGCEPVLVDYISSGIFLHWFKSGKQHVYFYDNFFFFLILLFYVYFATCMFL